MKVGNFAPIATTGLVLFNVFVFILVSAFAMDDTTIGESSNVYVSLNESGEGLPGDIASSSFFDKFTLVIWDLPWWFNVFLVFVNLLMIPIVILAWVRGL